MHILAPCRSQMEIYSMDLELGAVVNKTGVFFQTLSLQ